MTYSSPFLFLLYPSPIRSRTSNTCSGSVSCAIDIVTAEDSPLFDFNLLWFFSLIINKHALDSTVTFLFHLFKILSIHTYDYTSRSYSNPTSLGDFHVGFVHSRDWIHNWVPHAFQTYCHHTFCSHFPLAGITSIYFSTPSFTSTE